MDLVRMRTFSLCVIPLLACAHPKLSDLHATSEAAAPCLAAAPQDTIVRDTTEVTTKPRLHEYPDLHYPDRARQQHITGRVLLTAIIGTDGKAELTSIRVVRSADYDLDTEAVRFLRAARYWPGCLQEHPVRVRVTLPIDFRISGG